MNEELTINACHLFTMNFRNTVSKIPKRITAWSTKQLNQKAWMYGYSIGPREIKGSYLSLQYRWLVNSDHIQKQQLTSVNFQSHITNDAR